MTKNNLIDQSLLDLCLNIKKKVFSSLDHLKLLVLNFIENTIGLKRV